MFQSPFSFEGRIRRLEFGFSVLIYFIAYLIALIFLGFSMGVNGSITSIFFFFLFVGFMWFMFAQGAKRCHDLGYSGFFQLIPFFIFILLFMDGKPGYNEYGPNPKGIGNDDGFSPSTPGSPIDQL